MLPEVQTSDDGGPPQLRSSMRADQAYYSEMMQMVRTRLTMPLMMVMVRIRMAIMSANEVDVD